FPRNLAQAEALDEMLGGIGRGLDAILFFDVPDDVGMERALKRAELEGRSDDTPEVIDAARRLPRAGGADRRALPRDRQARAAARRTLGRGSVGGDPLRDRSPRRGRRMIIRKSAAELDTMDRAGAIVAETFALLEEQIQPGITTGELDAIAEEHIRSRGGEPTFKGY